MSENIAASYAHCRRLARRAGSSFCYSFLLLPRQKRRAMDALYAFLRRTDDLGDAEEPVETRRRKLAAWHDSFVHAMAGQFDDPLWPALADTVERYAIPQEYLFEAIAGACMDLDQQRYPTFTDLEQYCYRAASVVGLACIHVWGFSDPAAHQPARQCGIAFQLTNILRDLKEDAQRDRIYLPLEDLQRFDYSAEELQQSVRDDRLAGLLRFQIERAERYYREAEPLVQYLGADGRRVLRTMVTTYRSLLDEIKRQGGNVLDRRIRVGVWKKVRIAASLLW